MEFKALPRTIADTLELRRKYIIPRFQRDYSWEVDELSELWEDLLDSFLIKKEELVPSEYFIGSLVLVGEDDDNMNIERYVVDGQQRLMTITIIFAVLYDLFLSNNDEKLANIIYSYIVGEDTNGNEYTKLVTESPKPFFQLKIQNKGMDKNVQPKTDEEKRILYAYDFFTKRLSRNNLIKEVSDKFSIEKSSLKYIELLKLFRDQVLHCKVIYVTVKSFEDAYAIFEVLNAKGKDLTPIDVIKNSIFSIIDKTEPVDLAEEQWKKIKSNISGTVDILTFYRHFWISKHSYSTARKLVKEFNVNIDKSQSGYAEFLEDLVIASKDYSVISNPNRNDWNQSEDIEIYNALVAFDIFGVTQIRIFLLALFEAKRKNTVSHKQMIRVITFLEHFHFAFNAVCSMRPSGLERRYSSYARRMRKCADKNETKQCIDELIEVLKEKLPDREYFLREFRSIVYTSNMSKNKRIVQYILKSYEYLLMKTKELQPLSFTIEHIMPESAHNEYCGLVGNLLPLGKQLNSELENKDFALKMRRYPESRYDSVKEFVESYNGFTEWTPEMILERTDKIANKLYDR